MEGDPETKQLSLVSYEELERMRIRAFDMSDAPAIVDIQNEARVRDRWDDTDPRFAHLIADCQDNIDRLMVEAG